MALYILALSASQLTTEALASQNSTPHHHLKANLPEVSEFTPVLREGPRVKLFENIYNRAFEYSVDWEIWAPTADSWDFGRLAVGIWTQADVYGSYDIPAFWFQRNLIDWVIFNPSVSAEASGTAEIKLELVAFELIFSFKLMGAKYTPLSW